MKSTLSIALPLLLALYLCIGLVRAAELDSVQSHLLGQYQLPVRWENIAAKPQRFVGASMRTAYRVTAGMHVVELQPDGHASFYLPPEGSIRVVDATGEKIQSNDVEISISDGSGLHTYPEVRQGGDGRSLVVSPGSPVPLVGRVALPRGACKPACLGVFVSYVDPLGEIAPYRCLVPFPTAACKVASMQAEEVLASLVLPSVRGADMVQRCDEAAGRQFWRAEPTAALKVELLGPVRLAVQTRLRYRASESRSDQAYRIFVGSGKKHIQTLEYHTRQEDRWVVTVNGSATEVLGRLETAYLEVPPGRHSLAFDVTAPLYLRVLAQRECDYHLPEHNAPHLTADAVRSQLIFDLEKLSPWDLTPEAANRILALPPEAVAEKERLALRLVRDNRHREGGLVGSMLLREVAMKRLDFPQVRESAEKLRGSHTSYRDLLPLRKVNEDPQRVGYFLPRRLAEPGEATPERLVPPSLREDALDRLPSSIFLRLPMGKPGLLYPIPERFGPSLLRVVAQRPVEGWRDFFARFDNSPPIRLRIHSCADVEDAAFAPSSTEAALDSLPGPAERRTLSGPFTATRQPAFLLKVGVMEIPLPANVKSVRLWAVESKDPPVVAVQYCTGRTYRLSEMEYLEALRRVKAPSLALRAVIGDSDDPSARELTNHWQPLHRLLEASDRLFRSAVVPATVDEGDPRHSLDPAAARELLTKAQLLANESHWLAALPLWAELVRNTEGDLRRTALFGRVDALSGLGEQYLTDRLLRAAFLFEPDAETREEARRRLEASAQRAGDENELLALAAIDALRQPTSMNLTRLTEALVGVGEYDMALMVGLNLPVTSRPVEALLRAAFRARWWQVYDSLVEQLPASAQGYWKAHRLLASGEENFAELPGGLGQNGAALLSHLEEGRKIRNSLESTDSDAKTKALTAWGAWQQKHPGPYTWLDANDLVLDARGAESVYAVSRDLYSRFYEASSERPVKLGVMGPVRLKIEARPYHLKGPLEPLDDWLILRESNALRFVAVNNNLPTDGLQLVGKPDLLLGTRVDYEFDVGPGWHEFAIFPESRPTLFRVYTWRPEMPLRVLPVLSSETVRAFGVGENALGVVRGMRPVRSAFKNRPGALKSPPANVRPYVVRGSTEVAPRYESSLDEEAALLAQGEKALAAIVERSAGPTDDELRWRMTTLVRFAERFPAEVVRAEMLGQALCALHPDVPQLDDLRRRLTRRTTWVSVTDIDESAGVRRLSAEGWNPESPMLSCRRNLMGTLHTNDQLVAGYDRLVLSLKNLKPTQVALELAIAEVIYLPGRPLTAVYQVDEGVPVEIDLRENKPTEMVNLGLLNGEHSVRVWIKNPMANQYLRVGLNEQDKPMTKPLERSYHVATKAEPLRVNIEGPAWVRIDELRDGATLVWYYQATEPGLRTIVLLPQGLQQEALFRVFRRAEAKDVRQVQPRWVVVPQVPVAPPLVTLGPGTVIRGHGSELFAALYDHVHLGLQDLGTFSFTAGVVSRRPLAEDFASNVSQFVARPDEFIETRLTHRLFDEGHQTYSRSDFVLRQRDNSGPTIGVLHHLRYDPPGVPLTFHLEGNAFAQRPQGSIEPGYAEQVEWSGLLRGRVSQFRPILPTLAHEPSFSAFGRLMSLDHSRYLPGRVDQDIFTPYKAAHQVGWVLSDALIWDPWLDTRLTGRLALTSNENFLTPDNLTMSLGAQQLFAPCCEVCASYRYVQFFPYRERGTGSARHIVDVNLLLEHWYQNRDRMELALGGEYEFVRSSGGVQALFTWHFGSGRGYRDFRHDEVDFRDLRRRRLAEGLQSLFDR